MLFGLSAVAIVAIAATILACVAQVMKIVRADRDYQEKKAKAK